MEESSNRPSSGAVTRGAFYREMSAEIVRRATRAGLLPARAEDVTQSVWLKFFKQFPDFAEEDVHTYHRAWLLKVARHEIVNAVRAERRLCTCSLGALNGEIMDQHEQGSTNRASDDAHLVLFRRWLEELSQSDPVTFELVWERHIEGTEIVELAARTGRDARWISDRIRCALNKFRVWLLKHTPDAVRSP